MIMMNIIVDLRSVLLLFHISSISQPTGTIQTGWEALHRPSQTTGAKVGIYKNGRVEIIPNDQGQTSRMAVTTSTVHS